MFRKKASKRRRYNQRMRRVRSVERLEDRRVFAGDVMAPQLDTMDIQDDKPAIEEQVATTDHSFGDDRQVSESLHDLGKFGEALPDITALSETHQVGIGTEVDSLGQDVGVTNPFAVDMTISMTAGDFLAGHNDGVSAFDLELPDLGVDPTASTISGDIADVTALGVDAVFSLDDFSGSDVEGDPFFGGNTSSSASVLGGSPGYEDASSMGGQQNPVEAVAQGDVDEGLLKEGLADAGTGALKVVGAIIAAQSGLAGVAIAPQVIAAGLGGYAFGTGIDKIYTAVNGQSIGEDLADRKNTLERRLGELEQQGTNGSDATPATSGTDTSTSTATAPAATDQAGMGAPEGAGTDRDAARNTFDRESRGADLTDPLVQQTLGLIDVHQTGEGDEYAGAENLQNPVVGVITPTEETARIEPSRELGDRDEAVIHVNPEEGSGGSVRGPEVL